MRAPAIGCFLVLWLGVAPAQAQQVRLAAPADCLVNPGCGVGPRSVYELDATPALVPLTVADAGVAVAASSDPLLSRADIVTLSDDRRMLYPDRVVPVVRRGLLHAYRARDARDIRRRLNAASAALTTSTLRAFNQAVDDGRLPEAVGGEFAEAYGLATDPRRRRGPRIDIGYMDFAENQTLAYAFGEALRAGGYRVSVRRVGGLRPEAVARLRSGEVDLSPAYDGSLLRYLVGTAPAGLRRTLARIGAEPMRLSRAQNRNVFVVRADTATRLGLARLSDLARYWGGTT
jgi:glycine betaine/choline ABC-type transport system substrate-binding protein